MFVVAVAGRDEKGFEGGINAGLEVEGFVFDSAGELEAKSISTSPSTSTAANKCNGSIGGCCLDLDDDDDEGSDRDREGEADEFLSKLYRYISTPCCI